MNFKYRKPREQRQLPLKCKYRYRGMSKTNYRKQGNRRK